MAGVLSWQLLAQGPGVSRTASGGTASGVGFSTGVEGGSVGDKDELRELGATRDKVCQ